MSHAFEAGDRIRRNCEAGRVVRAHPRGTRDEARLRRRRPEDLQYVIRSGRTDAVAPYGDAALEKFG